MWWGASWRRALADLGYDGGMLDLGELIPADAALGRRHHRPAGAQPLPAAVCALGLAGRARRRGPTATSPCSLRSGALGAQRFQSAQWNGDAVMRWEGPDGLRSMIPGRAVLRLERLSVLARRSRRLRPGRPDPRPGARAVAALAAAGDLDVAAARPPGRPPALADRRLARRGHARRVPAGRARARQSWCRTCTAWPPRPTQTGLPLMRFCRPGGARRPARLAGGPGVLPRPVVPGGAGRRGGRHHAHGVPARRATGSTTGAARSTRAARRSPCRRRSTAQRPPVFARAGAIIPLAPEYDSLDPSTDPSVRRGAATWSCASCRAAPPGTRVTFTLYDGTVLHLDRRSAGSRAQPASAAPSSCALPDGTATSSSKSLPAAPPSHRSARRSLRHPARRRLAGSATDFSTPFPDWLTSAKPPPAHYASARSSPGTGGSRCADARVGVRLPEPARPRREPEPGAAAHRPPDVPDGRPAHRSQPAHRPAPADAAAHVQHVARSTSPDPIFGNADIQSSAAIAPDGTAYIGLHSGTLFALRDPVGAGNQLAARWSFHPPGGSSLARHPGHRARRHRLRRLQHEQRARPMRRARCTRCRRRRRASSRASCGRPTSARAARRRRPCSAPTEPSTPSAARAACRRSRPTATCKLDRPDRRRP